MLEAGGVWRKEIHAGVGHPDVDHVYCYFGECEDFLRIRERSPWDPPRARCAFLLSPHTELIMWGVHASAPPRRRVSLARMRATSRWSSGSKTGAPLR
jgi:hypothetical protein